MNKAILLFVLVSMISLCVCHVQPSIRSGQVPSKGVNLGGWLVAEHWMTSTSPIWTNNDDINNKGENYVMKQWGHGQGDSKFEQHRSQWIVESDIAEIAKYGLNTVRVPVGYWLAGFDATGGSEWQTYAPGAVNHLDNLIRNWAVKYNIAVLISIHAAKGSQNGNDHSAPSAAGQTYWSQYPENVQNTQDFAVWLADRYRNDIAFLGIGLLNEPTGTTDSGVLHAYYDRAYHAIRNTGNDCVLTHAPLLYQQDPQHDGDLYGGYSNFWHEWHKYLIWGYEGQSEDQIQYGAIDGVSQQIRDWRGNYMFIGEWSVATNPSAPFNDDQRFKQMCTKMTAALNQAHSGWTYWTWKVSYDENGRNAWSLRSLLRKGLFTFGV